MACVEIYVISAWFREHARRAPPDPPPPPQNPGVATGRVCVCVCVINYLLTYLLTSATITGARGELDGLDVGRSA